MYCLKPAVKHVPKGDWFCPDCRPKEVMRTPRKQRRKSRVDESSEEEAETSSDEDLDSSEKEDEEEDENSSDEEDSSDEDEDDSDEEESDSDEEEEEEEEKEPPKIKFLRTKKQPTSGRSTPTSVRSGRSSRQNTPKETSPVESRSSRSQKKTDFDTSYEKPTKKSRHSVEKTTNSRKSLEKAPKTMGRSRSSTKLNTSQEQPRSRSSKRARSSDSEDDSSPAKKVAATKSRGGEQASQMKLCEKLVFELADHDDAWPFLAPVLRKEVPDYYEIVKKPMDFQTMKIKINKLEYDEPADILEDLRLIFANCEEYNVPTAKEYKAGQRLCCLFVQRVKAMKLDIILSQKGQNQSGSKKSPQTGSSRRSRRT
jgi:bromodomain adjacent to zinc finger domain protein 1A